MDMPVVYVTVSRMSAREGGGTALSLSTSSYKLPSPENGVPDRCRSCGPRSIRKRRFDAQINAGARVWRLRNTKNASRSTCQSSIVAKTMKWKEFAGETGVGRRAHWLLGGITAPHAFEVRYNR